MQKFRFEPPFYDPEVLAECCVQHETFARVVKGAEVGDDQCWELITEALRRSLEQQVQHATE